MSDPIDLIEKKVRREYTKDGIIELLLSIQLFFNAGLPNNLIFFIFSVISVFKIDNIVEMVRSKLTYPRIGYAELKYDYSPTPGISFLNYIFGIIYGLSISYVLYRIDNSDLPIFWLLPTFIGFALSVLMLHQKEKADDRWAIVYAAVSLISGLVFSFNQFIDPVITMQYYLLSQSAFYLVAGGLRLALFIRSHPVSSILMEDV